jgi:DivIVA domain-containing protein
MALNRESIERRDFPTARRGYDPAAVDAHLRGLAAEVEALVQQAERAGAPALGSAAATQVQGILDAAQATAAEIEREARSDAQGIREEAAQDAERARAHIETLAQTAAALRARVEMLDGEVNALALSLRSVKGELSAVAPPSRAPEQPIPTVTRSPAQPALVSSSATADAPLSVPPTPASAPPAPSVPASAPILPAAVAEPSVPLLSSPRSASSSQGSASPSPAPALSGAIAAQPSPVGARGGNDLDGARLVVLNMALSGESREQADRYIAENFELADPQKLLDEVYAAVKG